MHTQKCATHKSGKQLVTGEYSHINFLVSFLSVFFNRANICPNNKSNFQT